MATRSDAGRLVRKKGVNGITLFRRCGTMAQPLSRIPTDGRKRPSGMHEEGARKGRKDVVLQRSVLRRSSRNNDRRNEMVKRTPIHALRDTLESARLQAIRELASTDGTIPSVSTEALQRVAFLQIALVAVREELAAHEVKIGGGSEQPLE